MVFQVTQLKNYKPRCPVTYVSEEKPMDRPNKMGNRITIIPDYRYKNIQKKVGI